MASLLSCFSTFLLLGAYDFIRVIGVTPPNKCGASGQYSDIEMVQFALNLEFLEAEFFLNGALGKGLDDFDPSLARGGPPPIGGQTANLDPKTHRIIEEFGYEEIGHIRAIVETIGGIQRPQLNISRQIFEKSVNDALNTTLSPPFNAYANSRNFLLASYIFPYLGLVGYVGTIPHLHNSKIQALTASLLGVEAGQDAVIRTLLYERVNETVSPYRFTVGDLTDRISKLRNRLGMCGVKDEGLIVPLQLGAEKRTTSNILSADSDSLSYSRTPREILRTVYGTGDESKPGGFYPNGGNGKIARSFLR